MDQNEANVKNSKVPSTGSCVDGQNGVYMRLIEYSQYGRTFRRWTYERSGEKIQMKQCTAKDILESKGRLASRSTESFDQSIGKREDGSPLARRLKQQRVLKEEQKVMAEEAAARELQQQNKEEKATSKKNQAETGRITMRDNAAKIEECKAVKELNELYRDLLERFEDLRRKQESQIRGCLNARPQRGFVKAGYACNHLNDASRKQMRGSSLSD